MNARKACVSFAIGIWTTVGPTVFAAAFADDGLVFFHQQVEPILRNRCFGCHSHRADPMEGGLSLDWRSGWETGGNRGPAIAPGKVDASLLIRAIRHVDNELQMPDEKLPDDEIAILVRWVELGAPDDRVVPPMSSDEALDWWSLNPLERPSIPPSDTATHPIDCFLQARLSEKGLAVSGESDRRTLIRRVYYDLVGLPPTPDEVDAFIQDDDPLAYETLVDRLLSSPRLGERWARHWLDTIHFADSHGFEHDVGRDNAWRFRDYVVDSFNRDTIWPRFIREQLAADAFFPDEPRLTPALGFLGAGTFDLSAFSTAPITFDYLDRDDLVTQTMAAFVSTTANCARCHAHKFDPISQEDYYSLQAVFAGLVKGDVSYDEDPVVGRERKRLQSLLAAIERRDADILLAAGHAPIVAAWLAARGNAAHWRPLQISGVASAAGATLSLTETGAVLSAGARPDRDDYTLIATVPKLGSIDAGGGLPRQTSDAIGEPINCVTALRLDLLAHDSLPMRGPGRQDNGNLHLSEIELRVVNSRGERRPLPIRRATADFNQSGWGVERAVDGDLQSAWGIYPAVGQGHYAVFELADPLALLADELLEITLRQQHGAGHLIGAFQFSATGGDVSQAAALPAEVEQALAVAAADRTTDQNAVIAARALKVAADAAMTKLPPSSVVYAAAPAVNIPGGEGQFQARSLREPKVVHRLHRGDFDKPREVMSPGALAALKHLPSRFALNDISDERQRRAALADWIAHHDNPLTWRSVVNRVWHYHFGRGLCDTPSDFGRMGGLPSHPELLDWLAVWFRDDAGGSLKKLHRLIVTSHAYRQTSRHRPDSAMLDADNRLLWRQNRQRLDADAVRDFALASSGRLDLTMGGPGVRHFHHSKGPQVTPVLDYAAFDWSQPGATRRSIYRFVWRGIADPFMESLDFPDLGLLAPARGFSASPLQALALFNSRFALYCSDELAKRAARDATTPEEQVRRAVRFVWQREPSVDEQRDFADFARRESLPALCRILLNSNEFLFVD